MISCFYNDNYDCGIVKNIDPYMPEGPYGYKDGLFDVTIKKADIVIDAGAWIGNFSAYVAGKGAISYAFELMDGPYNILIKTSELNGNIIPIKKGLGINESTVPIFCEDSTSTGGGASIIIKNQPIAKTIDITSLDKFVEENDIKCIDFIKADIEGAERDMLRGASGILKNFAPKLAICTYHLPDDPEILEKIILEINPNYKIVHLRKKLFACVLSKGN